MANIMSDLQDAARRVVIDHLGVRPGETVVVITDLKRRRIGLEIFTQAVDADAEAILIEIVERETHGSPPPDAVAAAMLLADVIIAPTTMSLSHTKARIEASNRGARCATMPLITEEIMVRCLAADPERLVTLGAAYAEALSNANVARVTSPGGSDCTLVLDGRKATSDDGMLRSPGAMGNLPAGEAFIAPVEGKAEGVLVFDGSLSPDLKTLAPVRVVVSSGRVTEVSGGPAPQFVSLPEKYGPLAWEVAELGIGTNDKAIITGNVLEDEKVASSVHVAFGNNVTMGGTTDVPSHHDGVILQASLELDGELVLDRGRLLLPRT